MPAVCQPFRGRDGGAAGANGARIARPRDATRNSRAPAIGRACVGRAMAAIGCSPIAPSSSEGSSWPAPSTPARLSTSTQPWEPRVRGGAALPPQVTSPSGSPARGGRGSAPPGGPVRLHPDHPPQRALPTNAVRELQQAALIGVSRKSVQDHHLGPAGPRTPKMRTSWRPSTSRRPNVGGA